MPGLAEKIKKLPRWARGYIQELETQVQEATDLLDGHCAALSFDETLISLWEDIASLRLRNGDPGGAERARRAARIRREAP